MPRHAVKRCALWVISLTSYFRTVNLALASTKQILLKFGRVAQSVEQGTENPCVGGSIPSPATFTMMTVGVLLLASGCGDRCESLCRELATEIDACRSESLSWADLGARSRPDFVEQCRRQWEQERADLSPNSLVLSLDVCQATQEELPQLDCDVITSLYAGDE